MDKLFVVARREFLERVRSRVFVAMTLLIPLLMSGAVLVPTYIASRSRASTQTPHVVILDATGSGLGARVARALTGDSAGAVARAGAAPAVRTVAAAGLAAAESAAVREVMPRDGYQGYLVLDDSTLAGRSARYAGKNASSIPEVEKLTNAVRQGVVMTRLEREGVRPEVVGQVTNVAPRLATERLDERGRGSSGRAGIFLGIGVAILLFMSILLHGANILRSVLEEKTSRVAEVVLSSVKPDTLLAGKVLGVGAVGLLQQILWVAIAAYVINMVGPLLMKGASGNLGAAAGGAGASGGLSAALGGASVGLVVVVFLYFILGFAFYGTLFAAAGSMVSSEQDAQQATWPVMMPLMFTWIMVNPILLSPNGTMAVVLSWLPFSSPIVMPMRMGLVGVPWTHVAGSLAVAALGSAGAIWLAARIYRVGMLMYGKRPSFGEVARWVRVAG